MKTIAVIGLLSLLLAACGGESEPLRQTRDDREFTVSMHIVDERDIAKTCADLGVLYEANGCAAFNLDTKHCDVYVMPQRFAHDGERLETIGHELWHCRFGRWHD
jgi:hypothetical protein